MSFIRMKPHAFRDKPSPELGDRASQCDGKKAHPSYGAAATAIGHIRRRGGLGKNNIYKCRFCQQWHIGQKKD